MNTSLSLLAVPVALAVGFFAGHSLVPAPAAPSVAAPLQDEAQEAPPMDEVTARLTQPGEHHQVLDVFVGTWDAEVSAWEPGGAEPFVFAGTMTARTIMDGRFVEQRFTADFQGQPFQGMAITGYSGGEQVYEQIWIDSWTTDMAYGAGSASPDGLSLTFLSTEFDPETGRPREVEERTHIVSRDEITYERWTIAADGSENFRSMRVVYKRKAAEAQGSR